MLQRMKLLEIDKILLKKTPITINVVMGVFNHFYFLLLKNDLFLTIILLFIPPNRSYHRFEVSIINTCIGAFFRIWIYKSSNPVSTIVGVCIFW